MKLKYYHLIPILCTLLSVCAEEQSSFTYLWYAPKRYHYFALKLSIKADCTGGGGEGEVLAALSWSVQDGRGKATWQAKDSCWSLWHRGLFQETRHWLRKLSLEQHMEWNTKQNWYKKYFILLLLRVNCFSKQLPLWVKIVILGIELGQDPGGNWWRF